MAGKDDKGSKLKAVLASAGRITKKGLRAAVLGGAVVMATFGLANLAGKWVYQVRTNYGVVITDWDGQRIAVDEPGWHSRIPLLSTYEDQYPLANQVLFLHDNTMPHQVITRESGSGDGSVIMAAAATFYEITDLRQYAIENVKAEIVIAEGTDNSQYVKKYAITPRAMLQRTLDSVIGDYIQKRDPKDIIHNRGEVEKEILESMVNSDIPKKYGISISSFRLTETGYIPSVVDANAKKQANVTTSEGEYAASMINKKRIEVDANARKQAAIIEAEGEYAASQMKKKAIETLSQADAENYRIIEKALNPTTPEEKRLAQDIFRSLIKYRTIKDRDGDTVWIVPDSAAPVPTFNPAHIPKKE